MDADVATYGIGIYDRKCGRATIELLVTTLLMHRAR